MNKSKLALRRGTFSFPFPQCTSSHPQNCKRKSSERSERSSSRHKWKSGSGSKSDQNIKGTSWFKPDCNPASNTKNKQVKMKANKSSPQDLKAEKKPPSVCPFWHRGEFFTGEKKASEHLHLYLFICMVYWLGKADSHSLWFWLQPLKTAPSAMLI